MNLMIMSTSHSLLHPKFHLVNEHTTQWGVTFDFYSMERHLKSWNSESKFPHPGRRIVCQLIKYLQKLFAI